MGECAQLRKNRNGNKYDQMTVDIVHGFMWFPHNAQQQQHFVLGREVMCGDVW